MMSSNKNKKLVKIGKDCKIKIPKEFCSALNIKCGDFLLAKVVNKKLVFIPKLRGEVTLSKAGKEQLNESWMT